MSMIFTNRVFRRSLSGLEVISDSYIPLKRASITHEGAQFRLESPSKTSQSIFGSFSGKIVVCSLELLVDEIFELLGIANVFHIVELSLCCLALER